MRYNSPLRYPGGKARLADFVKAIFHANGLLDGAYAEPYAGGASVALTLLFEEHASDVYINDIDPGVHAFWHSVLQETEALCRLVRETRVTPREWERQRAIYLDQSGSLVALGFATFFLNRTNRSGIIASAGMIGGKGQAGRWLIDARYNPSELADRIGRVARYRDRIHLSNLDAADFLERVPSVLPAKSLVYLDPPYYVKGERKLYANCYEAEDHAKIARLIQSSAFHWIVSYDNVPATRKLYCNHRRISYTLQYTAAERQQGAEVMVFSPDLIIPKKARPTMATKTSRGGESMLVGSVQLRKMSDRRRVQTSVPSRHA
jgi:DNA adenine methylase